MSKTTAIVFIVVFALEAVVIIIGNVFTMFVFWTYRIRVKRACFLLINLAVADFLVGIAEAIVLAIEKIPNAGGEEKPVQRPWATFQVFTSRSYFAGTCFRRVEATASSRNKLSRLHLQHSYRVGARIVYGRAMGVNHVSPRHKYLVCDCHNTIFALVFLLVICASYLTVRSRLHRTAPALKDHTQNANERNLQLSKTFLMVVAVSFLLWFPA